MAETEKIHSDNMGSQLFDNPILSIYINDYIKKFRNFNKDVFHITISGIKSFIPDGDPFLACLFEQLKQYKFTIEYLGNEESVKDIEITCKNITQDKSYNLKYQIQNLPSIIELSSKTRIPVVGLITISIVSQVISKLKKLYKAIVLDLDETLWKGTLTEDGIDKIKENLSSQNGAPFIGFMEFIKVLCIELGVFVAICSKNEAKEVELAIDALEESLFPLKNHIDYIIVNHNDKSENIKMISEQLSILPNSLVFIDDNKIVRDEVKRKLPEVFVPEWEDHNELVTKLIAGCIFDRGELSINSQNRRKQYKILQIERTQNTLPALGVSAIKDEKHIESISLYSKSNQFKFSKYDDNFEDGAISLYYEIHRENGENLGICSAITYVNKNNTLCIINWALSCRYFDIGLEEFILRYIHDIANGNRIFIHYVNSEYNQKVNELFSKYSDAFKIDSNLDKIEIIFTKEILEKINNKTNLREV